MEVGLRAPDLVRWGRESFRKEPHATGSSPAFRACGIIRWTALADDVEPKGQPGFGLLPLRQLQERGELIGRRKMTV